LTLIEVDIPQKLQPLELLVKNVAVAQNPVDAKQVDYDLNIGELPWTNGGDTSGSIVAVGDKVESFKPGDRVASFLTRATPRHGAYQEYSIGIALRTFHIPADLSHEDASTIPLAGFTAASGIFNAGKVPIPPPGAHLPLPYNDEPPILVWGGSSSVGAYGIQFARLGGYRVISTASPSNFDYVKSLGAEAVFDYHDGEKAVEEIRTATGNKLRYVFDATSEHGSTALSARAIGTEGGVIGVVLGATDTAGRTDVQIVNAGAAVLANNADLTRETVRFISEALQQKAFLPNQVEIIPKGLLGVDEGWRRQRAGQISGVKLVYRIADTPGL